MTSAEVTPLPSVTPEGYGGPAHIQAAWRMLAGGAPAAVRALLEVAEDSESPTARVMAAKTILDRVGLVGAPEIVVQTVPVEYDRARSATEHTSPAAIIAGRLAELRRQAQQDRDFGDEVVDSDQS